MRIVLPSALVVPRVPRVRKVRRIVRIIRNRAFRRVENEHTLREEYTQIQLRAPVYQAQPKHRST